MHLYSWLYNISSLQQITAVQYNYKGEHNMHLNSWFYNISSLPQINAVQYNYKDVHDNFPTDFSHW